MNAFSDQTLARRMLETRDRGYSFGLFLHRNRKRYLRFVGYFGLVLIGLAMFQFWMLFCFILGMACGCILRDIGWFRTIGRTWPFSVKIIDWAKVQRLADDKPLV